MLGNRYSYEHTESSIMLLNSALDAWQSVCILEAEVGSSRGPDPCFGNTNGSSCCAASHSFPEPCRCFACDLEVECDAAAFKHFEDFQRRFLGTLQGGDTWLAHGNGGFIHSCFGHCAASAPSYGTIRSSALFGNVTMEQAVSNWWHHNTSASGRGHFFADEIWTGPGQKPPNRSCPALTGPPGPPTLAAGKRK